VLHFNPLENIPLKVPSSQQKTAEEWGSTLTLALGCALSKKREIDLLPPQLKLSYKLSTIKNGSIIGICLLALTLFGFYKVVANQLEGRKRVLERNNAYLRTYQDKLIALEVLGNWEKKVKIREDILSQIEEQPHWEEVLKEISNIIPPGVVLSSLFLDTSDPQIKLFMKGKVIPQATSKESPVAEFLMKINDSPFFSEVKLSSHRRNLETKETTFELKCTLVY